MNTRVSLALVLAGSVFASAPHAAAQSNDNAVWGQLFAGAYATSRDEGPSSRAELTRAQLGSHFTIGERGQLDLVLESLRSAGPASLTGIDGDSLVVRVREAWGHVDGELGPAEWHVGAGQIPDLWRETLERDYALRALSPTEEILRDALPTADLGARAALHLHGGWIAGQITNGEGLNESEQNDAKAVEGVVGYTLDLDRWLEQSTVTLAGGHRVASRGVAELPADLTFGALTVVTPWIRAGGSYSHAQSTFGRPDVESDLLSAWAEGEVLTDWLGLATRVGRWDPDGYDNAANRYLGAVYSDLGLTEHQARLFVYVERRTFQPGAVVAPGVDAIQDEDRVGLTLDLRGRATFGPATP